MSQSMKGLTKKEKLQYWREHHNKHKSTSLSIDEYCRQEGISVHTFRYWRTQLNKSLKKPSSSVFNEVKVQSPQPFFSKSSGQGLPDPEWLAQFLKSLSGGRA